MIAHSGYPVMAIAGLATATTIGLAAVFATGIAVLIGAREGIRWVEAQPGTLAGLITGMFPTKRDNTWEAGMADWHRQEAERIAEVRKGLPYHARAQRDALLKDIDSHHDEARRLECRAGGPRHAARGK